MTTTRAILALPVAAMLLLPACEAGRENEAVGSLIGGAIGALLGSEIGGGEEERRIGVAVGAIIGSQIGGDIGRQLDDAARHRARVAEAEALSSASIGEPIRWEDPDNDYGPAEGTVTVKRQGRNEDGRTCREYTHEVTIAGESETVVGTACLGEDGRWTAV